MKINRKNIMFLVFGFIGVAVGILILFYSGRDRIGPGMVESDPGMDTEVKTVMAQIKTVTEWYEAVGTLRPKTETTIESQVSAQVIAVTVVPGEEVEKDQVLVLLDDQRLSAQVLQASQALQAAISQKQQVYQLFNAAQAAYNEAEIDHERIKKFYESQAATKQELERAESRFLQALAGLNRGREEVTGAVAGIRQAEEMLRESQILLEYTRIKALEKGTVLKRLAEPGDLAFPGKPLVLLKTSGGIRLESMVREGLIREIEPGMKLSAEITALDQTLTVLVEEIIPYADPHTRTFLVKAMLPAIEGVYPGMYGKLLIPDQSMELILIPFEAVFRVGQLEMVRVKEEDGWKIRYIKTGKGHEGMLEVLSGLSGNEVLMVAEHEHDRK